MRNPDLRFWYYSPASTGTSAGVSVLVHAFLIALWVTVTLPGPDVPPGSIANRVYYLPPPNRSPAQTETRETLRYVELSPSGEGTGFGAPAVRADLEDAPSHGPTAGDAGRDEETMATADAFAGEDSVYTIVDVDTVAMRLAESAAPRYPPELLDARITGSAIVQFIVDTTGRADVGSFRVIVSSRPEFAQSVREALPEMRFAAARIGTMKVRQLVELPFIFAIAEPAPVESTAEVPRQRRRRPE